MSPHYRGTLTWSGKTMHFWFQKWELVSGPKRRLGVWVLGLVLLVVYWRLGFSRWSWCFNLGLPFLGTASWRVRVFVRALLCTPDVWTQNAASSSLFLEPLAGNFVVQGVYESLALHTWCFNSELIVSLLCTPDLSTKNWTCLGTASWESVGGSVCFAYLMFQLRTDPFL